MPAAAPAPEVTLPVSMPSMPTIRESAPRPSAQQTAPPAKPAANGQPKQSGADEDSLMADSFSDLKSITAAPKEAPKPTAPKKPDESELVGEQKEPELGEEPATKPKVEAKPASGAATLRSAYENVKKRAAELEQEVKTLKESKPQEDPNLKTYKERLEAAEKRQQDLETELKYSAYERSDEYQNEYQKPFEESYNWGKTKVSKLKVDMGDGEFRQATPEDFDKIILIPDDSEAVDVAEKMFGNKARIVLEHRWELQKLDAKRFRAIEDFKKNGAERETLRTRETEKQQEQTGRLWKELNETAASNFPKWFKPEEGDEKGNQLLEEGYKLADAAFSRNEGKSPEELVRLHASIRNRAAAFTREVYRNLKLESQIEDMKKKLAEYEASVPGPGAAKSEAATVEEFEELQADR